MTVGAAMAGLKLGVVGAHPAGAECDGESAPCELDGGGLPDTGGRTRDDGGSPFGKWCKTGHVSAFSGL